MAEWYGAPVSHLAICRLRARFPSPPGHAALPSPYHRGFGERDMIVSMAVTTEFTNTRGYGRTLVMELTRPKTPITIIIDSSLT